MSRQRQKGTSWETGLVNWLADRGIEAMRLPLAGNKDRGDIIVPAWGVNLEAKNCRQLALAQWVAESDVESENAGRPVIVAAKRVGKTDPGEGYAIMPMRRLAHLLSATMSTEEKRRSDDAAAQ